MEAGRDRVIATKRDAPRVVLVINLIGDLYSAIFSLRKEAEGCVSEP
jgi:hypothetical protein